MSDSRPVFGIDLGTTYSSIGVYNPETHNVEIARLPSEGSNMLLPSAVFVESPDNVIVGSAAVNAGMSKPERLFRWFKRDLGTDGFDKELDGTLWTPVELSAEILKTLKQEAETAFITEVKDVVITFPAFFTPQQKDLTAEAARLAGLTVIRMCEEPHAAAIAFLIEEVLRLAKDSGKKIDDLGQALIPLIDQLAGGDHAIMVYDLGGGTFDVAMIQAAGVLSGSGLTELQIKTLCNDGNISLGGKDWDSAIMQLVCDKDEELNHHNPFNDPILTRFDEDIEKAKKTLARLASAKVICPSYHEIEISRSEAEQRTKHLLEKTQQITEMVITQTVQGHGIDRDGITMLLCGGMSNWPAVTEMLTQVLNGRAPKIHKTLDLLVTMGAAYLAFLSGVSVTAETVIDEATGEPIPGPEAASPPPAIGPLTISSTGITPGVASTPAVGIEVIDQKDPMFATDPVKARKIVEWLIPHQPEVGTIYHKTFKTVEDNQTQVDIVLYFLREREGLQDHTVTDLDNWHRYKTYSMKFPPKAKGSAIHVQLQYNEAGVIIGKAEDDTGSQIDIKGDTFRS